MIKKTPKHFPNCNRQSLVRVQLGEDNRERPFPYAPLAQLVEQLTLNQWVPCESKGHKERKRKGYKLPKSGVAGDAAPESNLREAVSITHL